jgi:type 1 glutamine amidotransferase
VDALERRYAAQAPLARTGRVAAALGLLCAAMACALGPSPEPAPPATFQVLVFTRTAGFRHDSIEAGVQMVRELGQAHGFSVEHTEDAARFAPSALTPYRVVLFLSTTGDVLDAGQQAELERYVRAGGSFVGVHAAADTEADWPWYVGLVGATFLSHPLPQEGSVTVVDRTHRSTLHLGERWTRYDEWYDFRSAPRGVTVLLDADQGSYEGSTMGAEHPMAWYHAYDGGWAWYTAFGHTRESYADPAFREHVLGGILWAAGQSQWAVGGAAPP